MKEVNQNYYWRQSSFAGGLFGSNLAGRDDLKRYEVGARVMTNFFPYSYGGFSRRTGTEFVNECKYADKKARLVSFVYSDEISFVLEVGDKYIRVYRDGGIVLNGDKPVEVETDYTEDDLPKMKFTQSADRLYICHPDHPVMMLSRYADIDWRLEPYQNKRGPFMEQNTTETTIQPSGKTGSITLTASDDVFSEDMVGSLVRLSYNVYGQTLKQALGAVGKSGTIMCNGNWSLRVTTAPTSEFDLEQSNDNGATWTTIKSFQTVADKTAAFTESGKVDHFCLLRINVKSGSGNGSVTIDSDPFIADGFAKITAYTRPTEVTAETYSDENDYLYGFAYTDATTFWSLGAWSKKNGYPRTCAFYQDRLFFGSTKEQPLTIWGSQTGNYDDFYYHDTPEDEDGVTFSLTSNQVNRPVAFISLSSLLAFTSSSEWVIRSGASQAAITPSSVSAVQQSAEGISDVDPILINDRVIYITKTGNYVRDMAYDYSTDSYRGDDQTLFNRDIFEGYTISDWCSQQAPDNIIWCCRSDGKLLSFTYIPNQEVQSWAIHETDGCFESCASIPGDLQDEAYFIVKRTINGAEKRYIEILAHKNTDMNYLVYSDCSLSYHGDPANKFSGLSHLEGKSVNVLANGSYIGDFTVTDGAVEIPSDASHVVIGLPYTSRFETLDIPIPRQDGTSLARKKRVNGIVLRLKDSYGGLVGINGTAHLAKIDMRRPDIIGGPAPLYNENYQIEPASEPDLEAYIDVVQDQPYPLTVLSIVAGVQMG